MADIDKYNIVRFVGIVLLFTGLVMTLGSELYLLIGFVLAIIHALMPFHDYEKAFDESKHDEEIVKASKRIFYTVMFFKCIFIWPLILIEELVFCFFLNQRKLKNDHTH